MRMDFWAPAALLLATSLSACGGEEEPAGEETSKDASVISGAETGVGADIGPISPSADAGEVFECDDDALEENDDLASAAPLAPGTHALSLCSEDGKEEDWFSIAATGGVPLAVALIFDHEQLDVDLELVDAEGTTLAGSQGVTGDETAAFTPEADMTVYARVFGFRAGGVAYEITIAADPACASDEDCGAEGQICVGLECITGCRAHSACPDDQVCVDYACVPGCRGNDSCAEDQVCVDHACIAGCRGDEACAEGQICDEHACVAGCRLDDACPEGQLCIDNACSAGCRTSEHCAEGLACIDNSCQEFSCNEDTYEPNSAAEQAASVTLDFSEAALTLCGEKDEDWFSVNLAADTIYQFDFTFSHEAGDIDAYLYAAEDPETTVARSGSTSDDESFAYRVPADGAGAYLVRIKLFTTGVYTQTYGASMTTVGQAECAEHFDCALGELCSEAFQCDPYQCGEEATCPSGLICDNASRCVECAAAADCPNAEVFTCEANRCVLHCNEDTYEPNSEREAAARLTVPVSEPSLTLCGQRDKDWFTVDLQAGSLYAFDLTFLHENGDIDATLYGPDDGGSVATGSSSSDNERFVYSVPEGAGGAYVLEVRLYSGYGHSYGLAVTHQGVAECSEHADCPVGRLCQDYACVDFVCGEEASCPFGLNCDDAGRCVTCAEDAHCALGHACVANQCVFQGGAPEAEPNDEVGAAQALGTLPATIQGGLGATMDVDWYTFTLNAAQSVTIETGPFEGDSGDTELWLYSDAGVTEVANNDDGGAGVSSRLTYEAAPGQYWIKLACTDADPEQYCPEPFNYILGVRAGE